MQVPMCGIVIVCGAAAYAHLLHICGSARLAVCLFVFAADPQDSIHRALSKSSAALAGSGLLSRCITYIPNPYLLQN